MSLIDTDRLPQSVKDAFEADELEAVVDGLNSKALRVAPCLADNPTTDQLNEAHLLLLGTLKRWAQAGAGALTQRTQTAGPFNQSESYDTRQRTGYNLWPSEIADLQTICSEEGSSAAFTVDTVPVGAANHSPTCSLAFGATYCSCGASLTRGEFPLYGDAP